MSNLNLVPRIQQSLIRSSKHGAKQTSLIRQRLDAIPDECDRYEPDPMIYAHYSVGDSDWYVASYDVENGWFFGLAIINGWYDSAEFGDMAVSDLTESRLMIELDPDLTPTPLSKLLKEKGLKLVNWRLVEVEREANKQT